jgi:hypothetical protein
MKTTLPPLTERKPRADADWLKTPYPNLIRYRPSGTYFGRVRVNGKLIRPTVDSPRQTFLEHFWNIWGKELVPATTMLALREGKRF